MKRFKAAVIVGLSSGLLLTTDLIAGCIPGITGDGISIIPTVPSVCDILNAVGITIPVICP